MYGCNQRVPAPDRQSANTINAQHAQVDLTSSVAAVLSFLAGPELQQPLYAATSSILSNYEQTRSAWTSILVYNQPTTPIITRTLLCSEVYRNSVVYVVALPDSSLTLSSNSPRNQKKSGREFASASQHLPMTSCSSVGASSGFAGRNLFNYFNCIINILFIIIKAPASNVIKNVFCAHAISVRTTQQALSVCVLS